MSRGAELSFHPARSAEDFARLAALAREIWTEHYTAIIGAAQVEHMLATLQSAEAMAAQHREGLRYTRIDAGSQAVGYYAVREGDDALILSKLYVVKSHRGRGIARAALDRIRAEHRPICIRLWVNRHNHGSIAAYHRLGFRIVRDEVKDIGGGFVMDDHVMEWRGRIPA